VITLLLFAAGLVLIVAGSELFTNAVEWAGFRLRLASGATGSLLAAWGTALPETVVPVVAIISRASSADSVATGAIVGAPFLLLTLGVAVTGLAVLARRGATELSVDSGQARRDLGTFVAAYTLVLIAVALPLWLRAVVAASVIVIYGIYVRAALRGGAPTEEMPEPLHLLRWYAGRPPGLAIATQLLVAIAMLVVGAEFFCCSPWSSSPWRPSSPKRSTASSGSTAATMGSPLATWPAPPLSRRASAEPSVSPSPPGARGRWASPAPRWPCCRAAICWSCSAVGVAAVGC
jgi:hypothetical protein